MPVKQKTMKNITRNTLIAVALAVLVFIGGKAVYSSNTTTDTASVASATNTNNTKSTTSNENGVQTQTRQSGAS